MTMNRVQFRSGLSMAEFMDRYGSEDQCEAALVASRWPDGFACPKCGGDQNYAFRREGRRYFQCVLCRHQSSVISGTIFEATKLPLRARELFKFSHDFDAASGACVGSGRDASTRAPEWLTG